MTREDIIRMAQEAGFVTLSINEDKWVPYLDHFAALVAAAEREACAKVCEQQLSTHGWAQACLAASAIRKRSNT